MTLPLDPPLLKEFQVDIMLSNEKGFGLVCNVIKNLFGAIMKTLRDGDVNFFFLHRRRCVSVLQVQRREVERYPEENYNLFTWKIANFGESLRKAKSGKNTRVESPPFYVCGYKCKLKLFPNGFKTGEHTHLSIFLRIMKGENDAILTWPFQKKVKVALIDQQENVNYRKDIVMSFIAHNIPECFAKLVNDENVAGLGFAQFVSHENLLGRRYIVDDTIFLQVRITPSL